MPVTTLGAALVLRTPAWARAGAALFVPLWIYGFFFAARADRDVALFGYLLPALAAAFLVWSARVQAVATTDGRLVVRNLFDTLTVPREEVGSVEIDDAGPSGRTWAIYVRTHADLRFRLDVTHGLLRAPLERQAAALRSWRDGRTLPLL